MTMTTNLENPNESQEKSFNQEFGALKKEILDSDEDMDKMYKNSNEKLAQEAENLYEDYKKTLRGFENSWIVKLEGQKRENFLNDFGKLKKSVYNFVTQKEKISEQMLESDFNNFMNLRMSEFEGEESKVFQEELRDVLEHYIGQWKK